MKISTANKNVCHKKGRKENHKKSTDRERNKKREKVREKLGPMNKKCKWQTFFMLKFLTTFILLAPLE